MSKYGMANERPQQSVPTDDARKPSLGECIYAVIDLAFKAGITREKFMEFIKAACEGYSNAVRDLDILQPRVHAHDLQKKGGSHLAACREFVQRKAMNGERVIWGSIEPVTLAMRDIEEMASEIAAAALNEERKLFYKG